MKREFADPKYKWDFAYLYKNDEEFKSDLKLLEKKVKEISKFKNKLNIKENFFRFLELELETEEIESKLIQYLHLGDIDQTDTKIKNLEGLFDNASQNFEEMTSFIAPELKSIGEKIIVSWLSESSKWEKEILGYKKFFEEAKHILDSNSEDLLSKVSRSRGFAFEMYDSMAYADKNEVKIEWQGKEQILTGSLYSEIMENSDPIKDQGKRLEANEIYFKHYNERKHSFAKIYEGLIHASVENVKLRNYKNCLQSSLIGDNVPEEIYKSLLKYGEENKNPYYKFLKILKDYFKLKNFYSTDSQLKLVKEFNSTYTVEEAKELIWNAYKPLGKEYLEKLEIAWDENKIDYFEDTNKSSGAYSSSGYKVKPIILMNWDDKLNSVLTLGHEIGHSVHTLFADEYQEFPLSDYPIILAEVASTFNEHLLYDYLIKNSKSDKEKIYLLQKKISDVISTFYRQIQFADFELQAHNLVENGTPLTADLLSDLYQDISKKYGSDFFDSSTSKKSYSWTYVSHFFESPFYVYKYAIDIVASYKFYEDFKNGNTNNIINFLKSGGKKDPLDILEDFGIDFKNSKTYDKFKSNLDELISELDNILKNKVQNGK